jgi:hypothetical protein
MPSVADGSASQLDTHIEYLFQLGLQGIAASVHAQW